jgi:translation initiation factor 1 (eIF-1/SUI1)
LTAYNLPIKEVSKKLSKKFACSASIVKDTIEMQGD